MLTSDVKRVDIKEILFIKQALDEFFNNYDKKCSDKTKSKIAFYCPSIKVLNENILPIIQEWYSKNKKNKKGTLEEDESKAIKISKAWIKLIESIQFNTELKKSGEWTSNLEFEDVASKK